MPTAQMCYRTPFGDFQLQRYPARRREPLQAWSAADTLLLEEIHRLGAPAGDILVVNDEHGALCVALQAAALWTDSALAALALAANMQRNQRPGTRVVWSTSSPPRAPSLVVLRVPKQLPYFEYQLAQLAGCLEPGSRILAAGMDKHLSPRVAALLERYLGPTCRHRGQRKARLFTAVRDERSASPAPPPVGTYFCAALDAELVALPNVFSRDQLDPGSRLLLEQLPALAAAQTLLDLACGNGVLGLAALHQGLAQQVVFCDESAMAIESTRRNAAQLMPQRAAAISFYQGDGVNDREGVRPDLILCNPPFHLNHAVDEFVGHRLLQQCAAHLLPGGRLCLVANRHLNYLPTLQRHFQAVESIARNSKFTVWLAQRDQRS